MPDINVTFKEEECFTCHCIFLITAKHQNRLIDTKETFFCPNGHSQVYLGKNKEQIQKELKETTDRLNFQISENTRLYSQIETLKKNFKKKKNK